MLPILQAEEQLARISEIGAGSATMQKPDREKFMRDLYERLDSAKEKKPDDPFPQYARLASMGMGFYDLRKKK